MKAYTHPINRRVVVVEIDGDLICAQFKADKYDSNSLKGFTAYTADKKRIRIADGGDVRLMSVLMTRRMATFLMRDINAALPAPISRLWCIRTTDGREWC